MKKLLIVAGALSLAATPALASNGIDWPPATHTSWSNSWCGNAAIAEHNQWAYLYGPYCI